MMLPKMDGVPLQLMENLIIKLMDIVLHQMILQIDGMRALVKRLPKNVGPSQLAQKRDGNPKSVVM